MQHEQEQSIQASQSTEKKFRYDHTYALPLYLYFLLTEPFVQLANFAHWLRTRKQDVSHR